MENQEIKSMEENEQSSDKLKNLINKYKEQNTITIKSQKKIQAVWFIYNLLYHIIIIYILETNIKNKGFFESGEIGIPIENSKLILPCGIYARFFT